ncbi:MULTISPECIES: restriction endonuclease subunit S [Bradyrhizobium]|uniref:restriction endonuclease subunit S n=1 Tax=Bradyrhizobium TaxID=374 RepID=UPI002225FD8F|nr:MULTISPECIES: restriction endonuclease subunit S [Bradyrhizobium]MCW2358840.1 type I restriction enzyme S subunit [Bradyrhizobium elkanii]MDI2055843.1 restriction endonuclease subunit S [Bradyrhizobium sp. Mp19]
MNAERLLSHYYEIADAPNAITRLRRFILDLAVRGKLVPQDAKDEPASALLSRIAAEKEQQTKRSKSPSPSETAPFEIPSCWEWTHLGAVADLVRGISFPASEKSNAQRPGLIPCLRSGNIQDRTVWDDLIYVPKHFSSDDQSVKVGDILISIANSYALVGKCSIVDDVRYEATFGAFLAAIRVRGIVPQYAKIFLTSEYSGQAFRTGSAQTTNIANITFSTIRSHWFSLPPLAEQHRIVAKVDELMILCDRLEAARGSREAVRDQLGRAIHARLNSPDPNDFREDVVFALESLPALTARDDQIAHLRRTILNLAVSGKLAPQDVGDEPAAGLLERIAKEKSQLLEQRGIKGDRPLPGVDEAEKPFSTPSGWCWARAQDLSLKISDGVHKTPNYVASGIPFVTVKNLTEGPGISFRETKFITDRDHAEFIKRTHPEKGDLLITKDGTIGVTRVVETDRPFSIFVSVALMKMVLPVIAPFLALCISADLIRDTIVPKGAALKHLHLVDLRKLAFPIPPLAEQHRILAKVRALMALCDRLAANLTAAAMIRHRLLEALLVEALGPTDVRKLEAAE